MFFSCRFESVKKSNLVRKTFAEFWFLFLRTQSISGRLRSASDLVDLGIIDRNQRNMLKDLIISNSRADEELQIVLDQYEKTGDTSGLQRLISEGRLLQQKDTFDLLDDLDLDFLNVGIDGSADQNDEEFERLVDAGTPGLIASTNYRHGVMVFYASNNYGTGWIRREQDVKKSPSPTYYVVIGRKTSCTTGKM